MQWIRFTLVMLFASALSSGFTQTLRIQYPGIDSSLLARANAGDATSQILVGDSYKTGKVVERDYTQAAAWYRKAAVKGRTDALIRLAVLYRDGAEGFPRDMDQSAAWYRKAAELGDVDAQATLGVLYSMGQGEPHSDADAYYWFYLAAKVKGPNQEKYAASRQMMGARITAAEQEDAEKRANLWIDAHPLKKASE
ncbi:MAG: tetratricopeptide repeat protein [Terracidiphilus sp.]